MAKTKISEFSSTPSENTDIDSINIAEGCAPSGINNAIRELMAQLKDFQTGAVGDSFNGPIGSTTPSAGAFTTLSASGAFTYGGVTLSNAVTGTGNMVLSNSPTLVTPALGTPSALVGTNITGTAAGLSIGGNAATATTSTNVSGGTASVTTLTTSSTVTHNGGTANGVAYLNGSKVLTTGSALTFDGTTLATISAGINTQNSYSDAINPTTASTNQIRMGASGFASFRIGTAYDFNIDTYNSASPINVYKVSQEGRHTWSAGGTRTMDLTSTGLGIGTSSPSTKLQINASGANPAWLYSTNGTSGSYFGTSGSGEAIVYQTGAYPIGFYTNSTLRATLDSSGNLGLGVTPSAWGGYRALQVGDGASISSVTAQQAVVSANAYNANGAGWKYVNSNTASQYEQYNGLHVWSTAPSGTAGNAISFSQVMTLTAAGDLLVGKTSTANNVAGLRLFNDATDGGQIRFSRQSGSATQFAAYFYESGGGVVGSISTTSSTTAYNTSSDYRLKNITGPITTSGAYIDSLNPVEGTWKADGSTFVGLIAHEVQEASRTNVATGVKDGEEMQGMDYSSAEIIANLIAEVKSLRTRVAALEAA